MAKANKYHATKEENLAGIFASKKEAMRYQELCKMQEEGLISNLERQVVFQILPSQKDKETGRVIERPVHYTADFVYEKDGKKVVEDTKGFATRDYILKRKLMLYMHGIRIKEV